MEEDATEAPCCLHEEHTREGREIQAPVGSNPVGPTGADPAPPIRKHESPASQMLALIFGPTISEVAIPLTNTWSRPEPCSCDLHIHVHMNKKFFGSKKKRLSNSKSAHFWTRLKLKRHIGIATPNPRSATNCST